MASHVATLGSARELLTFSTQEQDNTNANEFNRNTEISNLSYRPHESGSLPYEHGFLQQRCVPSIPVVVKHLGTANDVLSGTDNNNSRRFLSISQVGSDVRASSPDYDNLVPRSRLSQVVEEGVAEEEAESINEHCANFGINSALDAGGVGGVGTDKGGAFGDEGENNRDGLGYKSGYGDTSNNYTGGCKNYTHDDVGDIICEGAVSVSAADVNTIDMGNDLFSARASNVSDARAESHVSRSRRKKYGQFGSGREMCSNQVSYNKKHATDGTCNILHECNENEVSRVSLCVVSQNSELRKCVQQFNITDLNSDPSSLNSNSKYGSNYVSCISNGGGQNSSSFSNSLGIGNSTTAASSVMSTPTTTTTTKTDKVVTHTSPGPQSNSDTPCFHPQSTREIRGQVSELTSSTISNRDQPHNSTPQQPSTYIPLTSVSTPALSVIIVPTSDIGNAAASSSTSSPPPTNSSNPTSEGTNNKNSQSTSSFKIENDHPAKDAKCQIEPELDPQDQGSSPPTKSPLKLVPVGGVKVLPSTFIFNHKSFKETKDQHSSPPSLQSSAKSSTTEGSTSTETIKPAEENVSYNAQSILESASGVSGTENVTGITTSTINSMTEKFHISSRNNNFQTIQQASDALVITDSLSATFSTGVTQDDYQLEISDNNSTSIEPVARNEKSRLDLSDNSSRDEQLHNTENSKSVLESDLTKSVLESVSNKSVLESDSKKYVLESDSNKSVLESVSNKSVLKSDSKTSVLESDYIKSVSESDSTKSLLESATTSEKLSQGAQSSDIRHKSVLRSRQAMTSLSRSMDDDSWHDYAVPLDLSPETPESGYQSPERQILSPDLDESKDNISYNEKAYELRTKQVEKSTLHSSTQFNSIVEDIYAIPIPKSQRHKLSKRQVMDDISHTQTTQIQQPQRLGVSGASSSEHDNSDDVFEDVVMKNKQQARSLMKKSTTSDTLQSYSKETAAGSSRSYDYFSLGRRPKRPRVRTLIDSQGIAVSLDMLLKSRHQSFLDETNSPKAEQTLSVDDILRSCLDFDENSTIIRSRTDARELYTSPVHPLTFSEANNTEALKNVDNWKKTYAPGYDDTKSKPIAKKDKSSNRRGQNQSPSQKIRHQQLVAESGMENKIIAKNHSQNGVAGVTQLSNLREERSAILHGSAVVGSTGTNYEEVKIQDGIQHALAVQQQGQVSSPDSSSRKKIVKQSTLEKRDNTQSMKSGYDDNKKETKLGRNKQRETDRQNQQKGVSESTKKPDQLKSFIGSDASKNSEVHIVKHDPGSDINSKPIEEQNFPSVSEITNPDNDYPKDTILPTHAETETTSITGSNHNKKKLHDSVSTSPENKDNKSEVSLTSSLAAISIEHPSELKCTDEHEQIYIAANSTKFSKLITKIESQPFSKVSFSTNVQEIEVAQESNQINAVRTAATTNEAAVSHSFRNESSSSSETPASQRTGSDSSSVASPGVISSLSLDISDGSLGSSSPVQRSPNLGPKLEAIEALKWLRAAGFPQYAQMFDDGQFPVDMGVVERDHDFLDKDSLQSLFRRLDTLNKCAGIRIDALPSKKAASEEDDEDDFCALSERWEYQKSARRWSRKDLTSSQKAAAKERTHRDLATRSGSHDSLLADQDSGSQTGDSPLLEPKMPHQTIVQNTGKNEMASISQGGQAVAQIYPDGQKNSSLSPRLRRATGEKIKTAKSIFKKMDKSSKFRRQQNSRNIVEISGPVLADRENMQLRLDRLNCVDISHPAVNNSSSQIGQSKAPQLLIRSSSAGTPGQATSPVSPSSPQSSLIPPASPRPHSDFMLRPKEVSYAPHSHPANQPRSSRTSPTQNSTSSHDSSFDEYYHANKTFHQNLQSPTEHSSDGVRKNNSDTNLVEIFLVPQDHQPGRFPRILQNGYIETEACGTAVNARTGSVRLGRGIGLTSDNRSPNSRLAQSFSPQGRGQRISVYDNFVPADGKRNEGADRLCVFPGIIQLESPTDSLSPGGVNVNKPEDLNANSDQPDSRDTSRGSSVSRTADSLSISSHERSVSFESPSSSVQTLRESSLSHQEEAISDQDESTSTAKSSPDSISFKSKGVSHSSSVDSYFRDSSVQSDASSKGSTEKASQGTSDQDYEEFDRILQELYQNINDLTSFMDRDKNEKAPKLIRAATSPLPAGSPKTLPPLHVVATTPSSSSSSRPSLKPQTAVDNSDPSSSELVPSPATPTSPVDTSESLNFYGSLDLDNENSSSGGEGNTAESGSEDQEATFTDISHDDSLDQIIEVPRERRDSGVGHSLTRASSDRRHKKIRWHSFQKSHRPDVTSRAMQINSLTVGQLVRLQKLSLLRLTGIMEKCLPVNKSGWNWMVPRFMKRQKVPDFSDKNVFGVPLSVMAQRTGQPIPQCILYAMRYLRRTCQNAVGIFRKSGVKSKIQQLRDHLEAHPDTTNFDGENTYNVADMLKTYFRDLPECLLTNKMSETFRSIYTYVPQPQRLEAIQAAILLLPDENREVLQSILLFLSDIADHESDHQMNASNLAVCFTPTVFHLGPRQSVPYSPKRNRKNSSGVPDPREIMEQKAAHECLLMMVSESKKLFTVPHNIFRQLQVQSLAHMEPTLPVDIGNSPADIRAFGQERIQMVLKESHDKNRGWIPSTTLGDVEVFHRKPIDDCPLKEWKLVVDIEAPPIEVLRRIMHERHTWDEDLLSWTVVERLDPFSDIFQFVLNSMAPHPSRNFCVLRYWRSDLNKGACSVITMSVEHSDTLEIHGVWAIDLGTYYLMEPCGSGRSRLTYITRVDTRGRTPEWYTKIFGHISANFLERLKESFKQDTSGPETKL